MPGILAMVAAFVGAFLTFVTVVMLYFAFVVSTRHRLDESEQTGLLSWVQDDDGRDSAA